MSIFLHRYSILFTVIILTFCFALNAQAKNPDQLFETAKKEMTRLNASASKKKFRSNWTSVIKQFEKIARDLPQSSEAPKSLFHIGNLYAQLHRYSHLKSDVKAAISAYENLGDSYPQNSLADDALFLAAELYRTKLNNPEQAFVLYDKVLTRYPEGDMAVKARYWNTRLESKLASQPVKKSSAKDQAKRKSVPELDIKNPVTVMGIRYWSGPEYTRVVIDLSDRANYQRHLLRSDPQNNKPPRLYLDVFPARMSPELQDPIIISDGLLNKARASQYRKNVVRIVLDINSFEKDTVFHFANPFRVVVDIEGKPGSSPEGVTAAVTAALTAESPVEVPAESPTIEPSIENIIAGNTTKPVEIMPKTKPAVSAPLSLARQFGLKVKRIVVDPGHGGKDPGAIGPSGLMEKNINLQVARYLRDHLNEKGFQVIMTRDSDVFVDLNARTALAMKVKADLFISIHTNASPRRNVSGIETYYLNPTTDPETMRLAALENFTSPKGLSDIEDILQDLLLSNKIEESSIFAGSVLNKMIPGVKELNPAVENHGVKPAPFYVLVGASMPSILVEVSYISNPQEEKLLHQDDYLKVLARSIADGIGQYTQDYLAIANW